MASIKKEYDEITNIINKVTFDKSELDEKISCEIIKTFENSNEKYEVLLTFGDKELYFDIEDIKMINTIIGITLNSLQQFKELDEDKPTTKVVDW